MNPILVAVSGGIDSLVTAHLLQKAGNPITPVHFTTGFEDKPHETIRQEMDAVGKQLGETVRIIDLSTPFYDAVITDFAKAYAAGRTPNPCLVCNPAIKFGTLLDRLDDFGCHAIATGHYARILKTEDGLGLFRGLDPKKDQSYFLSRIPKDRFSRIRFPLGELTKDQVREIADANGLKPVSSQESQDICFLPNGGYADFLAGLPGFTFRPGPIVNGEGKVIGEHEGLHRYTIGQRRGINCPGPYPYYVTGLDTANHRLLVGGKEDLFQKGCTAVTVNWIAPVPTKPIAVTVKIRYRHQDVPALLTPAENHTVHIRFQEPQRAVTPGQGAVFYSEDQVLGGGIITEFPSQALS